jgi:MscS family membrane protein
VQADHVKGCLVQGFPRFLALCLLSLILGPVGQAAAQTGTGGTENAEPLVFRPIRTDSPRDTLASFLRVRDDLTTAFLQYRQHKTKEGTEALALFSEQARALIDLSTVPAANRRERGDETVMALLDIFGRIGTPSIEDAPDAEEVPDLDGAVVWRIPQTPIRIGLVRDGPRAGEFLFTPQTVRDAQRFFRGIDDLPLQPRMPFGSWIEANREVTGPLIPSALVRAVPDRLHGLWMDTPAWKVLLTILVYWATGLALVFLFRVLRRHEPENRLMQQLLRSVAPIAAIVFTVVLLPILTQSINLSGRAADVEDFTRSSGETLAWAWLFWVAIRAVFEWFISSPRTSEESYDANMLRLVSGILGVVGTIVIGAYGAQELGLPVMSLLAGLGIGGLAVALAIRPTLENLIGGFILYIDRPVRVGDFCTFDGQNGTIERIGIRSTAIRALDRTLISVPNAQFADMKLVNWARLDQMLIHETIGIRYETTPDQLRFVLANIREMLHSHPRIDPNTIRVRFAGYGASSLNIGPRIYAVTREWNDFHAIREDVFLRIYDIVAEAGTGFAFPSQTVYLGKDAGLDKEAQERAMKQVQAWRRAGKLPFPRMPEEHQARLEGTLDYPPRGSYEAGGEDLYAAAVAETLSTEPTDDRMHETSDNDTRSPRETRSPASR